VLRVLSGAGVVQAGRRGAGQCEGVIEFAVGQKSGIAGDGRAVEFQLELAVAIESEGVIFFLSPIGFLVVSAGGCWKRWGLRAKGANAMPKEPSHLGNTGLG
jgi:hypothetical protein